MPNKIKLFLERHGYSAEGLTYIGSDADAYKFKNQYGKIVFYKILK